MCACYLVPGQVLCMPLQDSIREGDAALLDQHLDGALRFIRACVHERWGWATAVGGAGVT